MSFRADFSQTPAARTANMRAITSRGNRTTECRFRSLVAGSGIRGWKMHVVGVPGSPDFFFPQERIAVFVDGCFWHGCPKCGHVPKTNRPYWSRKFARNKRRDAQVGRILRASGMKVLRFWECQVRDRPALCLRKLASLLTSLQDAGPIDSTQ